MSENKGSFWVNEEENELVIEDQDKKRSFYIEEDFELEGTRYLILVPTDEEAGEAVAFKLIDDQSVLAVVEDDEEFNRVKEKYMSM